MLLLYPFKSSAQELISGSYQSALDVAYDPQSKVITAYYESCSGWDELTKDCRFSCSFYLIGKLEAKQALIQSYFPADRKDDSIAGKITLQSAERFLIRLEAEHGGCANVQHFADDSLVFQLYRPAPWIQIRWVQQEFAYFYSGPAAEKKKKTFLRKEQLVYIDKVKGKWVHVIAHEKQHLSGWLRMEDLND